MSLPVDSNDFSEELHNLPFRWEVSFPSNLRLRNLRVFQSFESAIIVNTTSRLTRWTAHGIEGDLAERWTVSPDGKKVHFFLRRDGRFSDGVLIKATDVVWSIQRHFALKGQLYDEFATVIEGAAHISTPDDVVSGIRLLNDFEFVVTLKHPSRRIIDWLFGTLPTSIFKRQSISSSEDDISTDYPASGLYVIKEFSKERVVLKLNLEHWLAGEKDIIREVVITPAGKRAQLELLLEGQTDFSRKVFASRIDKKELSQKGLQFVVKDPICVFLRANFSGPVLSKIPGLSALINGLIDRNKLVNVIDNRIFKSKPKPIFSWSSGIESISNQFGEFSSSLVVEFIRNIQCDYPEVYLENCIINIGIAQDSEESLEVGAKLSLQLGEIGIKTLIVFKSQADISAAEQDSTTDFTLTSYEFSLDEPALTLPYLVGLNSQRMHLPPGHPVYKYKQRLSNWPDKNDQVEILREFNIIMRKEGIIIPLFADDSFDVFSNRFDISRVPPCTFYWRISDLRCRHLPDIETQ